METVGVGVGSVDHVSRVGVGSVGSQEYPVDVGMSLGKGILEIISVSSFLMQGSVAVQSPHVQSTVTLQLSPASVLGKLGFRLLSALITVPKKYILLGR